VNEEAMAHLGAVVPNKEEKEKDIYVTISH
jgi:hypothetical protein